MATNQLSTIRVIDNLRSQRGVPWVEKWRDIAALVIRTLGRKRCFLKTAMGPLLYIEKTGKLVHLDVKNPSLELKGFIEKEYGINAAEHGFKFLLHALQTEAYRSGRELPVYRFSHYDSRTKRLYISRFDGQMYRLDGDTIKPLQNGSDEVFFYDDPQWVPWFPAEAYDMGLVDYLLVNGIPFSAGDLSRNEARFILKTWILSVFFPELLPTKPFAIFWGEKGSGKSMAGRLVLKTFFGPDAEVTSVEAIKDDALVAALTRQPLLVLDNVDSRVRWLPNVLAGASTGTQFVKRSLYTTNDLSSYKSRSSLMINTRTTDFLMERDDIADRSLVFPVDRLSTFDPESQCLANIAARRPQLWAELLAMLNHIVRELRNPTAVPNGNFRMADFARFAATVPKALGIDLDVSAILQKIVSSQASFLFDDDPIYLALSHWIRQEGNSGREITAGQLQSELMELSLAHGIPFEFRNGKSLGQRLAHLKPHLSKTFDITIREDHSTHQKVYTFRLLVQPDSRIQE